MNGQTLEKTVENASNHINLFGKYILSVPDMFKIQGGPYTYNGGKVGADITVEDKASGRIHHQKASVDACLNPASANINNISGYNNIKLNEMEEKMLISIVSAYQRAVESIGKPGYAKEDYIQISPNGH